MYIKLFFTICKFYIKQGVECRFLFLNKSCVDTGVVLDKGPNDEHIVDWHHLNGEILRVTPWMLETKRPMVRFRFSYVTTTSVFVLVLDGWILFNIQIVCT